MHSMSLAEAFKSALFERIEDEFDIRTAREALDEYRSSGGASRPIHALWDECDL